MIDVNRTVNTAKVSLGIPQGVRGADSGEADCIKVAVLRSAGRNECLSGLRIISLAQVSGCEQISGCARWIGGVKELGQKDSVCFEKRTESVFGCCAQQMLRNAVIGQHGS